MTWGMGGKNRWIVWRSRNFPNFDGKDHRNWRDSWSRPCRSSGISPQLHPEVMSHQEFSQSPLELCPSLAQPPNPLWFAGAGMATPPVHHFFGTVYIRRSSCAMSVHIAFIYPQGSEDDDVNQYIQTWNYICLVNVYMNTRHVYTIWTSGGDVMYVSIAAESLFNTFTPSCRASSLPVKYSESISASGRSTVS